MMIAKVLHTGAICAMSVAMVALSPVLAVAQTSQLQQVVAPDCATTHDCGMAAPTINPITTHSSTPVISGTYDHLRAVALRVTINNVVYTLGADDELSAKNGMWTLDLSRATPLADGEYRVTVEAVDGNNVPLTASASLVVGAVGGGAGDNSGNTGGLLANTGQAIGVVLSCALGGILIAFALFMAAARRCERDRI